MNGHAIWHTNMHLPDIQGLSYMPDFITEDEEKSLVDRIYDQPWLNDLKRRVQHYGYKYDYSAKTIDAEAYLGPLPDWLAVLCQRLHKERIFVSLSDQVIINEYLPGQGISFHRDCVPCFGDTVASLSLGSSAIMQFKNIEDGEKRTALLEERSLVVLSDAARYQWQHAIPSRKSDIINGYEIPRRRRLSLTFRNVIMGAE